MEKIECPKCNHHISAESAYCDHCGGRIGEHKKAPWYHIHRHVYDWTLAWAYKPSAAVALFILSFAESSFFPIPPDVLLMPLVLGNRKKWLRYATICSIASVLGGIMGYCIGMWLWDGIQQHAFDWFAWAGFTQEKFDHVQTAYKDWDFWVVFAAGFTPLPFKLITITAGVFKINFAIFMIAAVISRSARFFLVAGTVRLAGPKALPFIDKYFNLLALVFTVLLVGGFVVVKYLF